MSKLLTVEVTDRDAVYVNGTRITGRHTRWGIHTTILTLENVQPDQVQEALDEHGYGYIPLDPDYCFEAGIKYDPM